MRRAAAATLLLALVMTGCQNTSEEDPVSGEDATDAATTQERMTQVCDTFDVSDVEGLVVPGRAEVRAVQGAFLDGYGQCTIRLDGASVLAIEVDFADSSAAQEALADEQWKTEDLSEGEASGFTGRTGAAQDSGGRAVLGDDDRVVRVNVEQSVIADDAAVDRVAGDVAVVVLSTIDGRGAEGTTGDPADS